jgi:CheY-like chemotaxis protein
LAKDNESEGAPERKGSKASADPELISLRQYAAQLRRAAPRPLTVLIVDDEESILMFVERVLREAGYTTAVASGGPEAVEAVAKIGSIDVLVTDMMMPGMTGDELARRLRQADPRIKVLYLTGYSDRLFKEKSLLWEGEAFLDKPCTITGLVQAISLLLFGRFDPSRDLAS